MRRLTELRTNCEEFIWQPDEHVLLVAGHDSDMAYVLKVLEQVEGNDEASLYLSIADEYLDADTYARMIASRCVDVYAVVAKEIEERGEPPLEPFPEALTHDKRLSPRDRVVMAIEHLGKRLPNTDEYRVVVVLLPLVVHDWVDYAKFVGGFARRAGAPPEPWSIYARLFLRDQRDHTIGNGLLSLRAEGVLGVDVDMSTDAFAGDLAQDAVDPAVPVAIRMQAILQLANIDLSYKRHEEAVKKFALLFDYYGQSDAPIMQAMCLQGTGDCLRMLEQPKAALERYQQGLAIALAAKSPVPIAPIPSAPAPGETPKIPEPTKGLHPSAPPVMLNLLLAAAPICMSLRQYEDARSYFADASKLAAKCMNPYAACDALQGEGDAQRALGKPKEALVVWRDCETIAEKYAYYDRLVTVLERILLLYREAQLRAEVDATSTKLEGARRLHKHGPSHDHDAHAGGS
jgi:tetratricopeptide (TPR) repeat protein